MNVKVEEEAAAWEDRLAGLRRAIEQLPVRSVRLRDGVELQIESVSATVEQAAIVRSVTTQAFIEFRGFLDPPNGSDIETAEEVAGQILLGGALIGKVEGKPVASARLKLYPDYLYVGRVGVIPAYRGRGIGAALMRYIEQIAAELNICEIRLGTREKLHDNVAFYRKLGYEIVKVQPHPRGPDMVVLFVKSIRCCSS